MTHRAGRPSAAYPSLPIRFLSLLLAVVAAVGLGTAAIAESAPGSAPADMHLVFWPDAPAASRDGWIPLHFLDGGAIGLVPAEGTGAAPGVAALAADHPGLEALGLYEPDAPYYLISRVAYERLQLGELPPAWHAVLPETGPGAPSPIDLARIPALARDRAQVLVRLPESMRAIGDSPGGRCRPLRTPAQALAREAKAAERAAAARVNGFDSSIPPRVDPTRTQPPEYWQSMVKAVNADHCLADLDYLSTTLQTRYAYSNQMNLACQYVYDEFSALGLTTSFDSFTYNGHAIKNVLGIKLGTVDPSRIYIIEGHLDSISPQPQTLAPGADDNGSGAVAVLEAARLFANIPTDYTIYFLCVTAEEQGLIGSEHFAAYCDQQNLDVRGVLDFDMVSWYDPAGADLWIEGFRQGVSSLWLMIALSQNAQTYAGLSTYIYGGEGWGSDHEPFHDHGFSAILSIENEWDNYPCYHRTCDTVDHVTSSFWAKIVAANAVTLGQLSQAQGALGAVHGTVTLAGGGDPSGATLRLQGTTYAAVTSDANGEFTLPSILPGSYTLVAEHSNYESVTIDVVVPDGGTAEVAVEFGTPTASSVQGFVRGRSGLPFYGARVEIEGQSAWTLTSLDGSFTITPVAPGPVNVSASYPGMFPRGTAVQVVPGQNVTGLELVLAASWDFEGTSEGLTSSAGWDWGTDAAAGAHSGTKVWGTVLGDDYENCADYALDFPALSFRNYSYAKLHLWSWYAAEAGADGGNLEASTDGGLTWNAITPTPGYDGTASGSCNVLNGDPVLTGSSDGWVERVYPLDPFLGGWVRLRLQFGSNNTGTARGWYVDDLYLQTAPAADAPGSPLPDARASRVALSIGPNPSSAAAVVALRLSAATEGSLAVFAADGRRVASLAAIRNFAAGSYRFTWEGKDDAGRAVPAGTYWVRFLGREETAARSVVWVR